MRTGKLFGVFLLILAIAGLQPAASYAAERAVVTKTYEMNAAADLIAFRLEGYDGEFSSTLTLPDGHVIKTARSNKINDAGKAVWTNEYTVKPAPKGKYTFTIDAPKRAYYNLQATVPLFSDVSSHWAEPAINDFVRRGIVAGYGDGRFGPNDLVSGEAFVKMVALALTEEQPNGKRQWLKTFRWKVKDEELGRALGLQEYSFVADKGEPWAKTYLAAAGDLGLTGSWTEEELAGPFKRKDVALMAATVVGLTKPAAPEPAVFQDIGHLPDQYRKAIDLVCNYGLLSGYPDGLFKPENHVTRAEAVKALSRLVDFLK
ncbi:S-layer homology domain-containing protein [Paenibacillus arenilitoris]|uniref:S-layer homology domain-containing protein n=1 Tax=Paenibacillus arenilitoris TaxID=2772299 RepID=A0A927H5T9_9BACL|nr:S-layer homology domain-containing protein [Paenibacillus arenilitoris]MBD2867904.1 S-layer homology domain-containing protein [Paenibacillus arenilitoris]